MEKLQIGIAILLCSLATFTFAANRYEGTVALIEAGNTDGSIFFNTVEVTQQDECSSAAGYVVPADHSADKVLSLLLSAKIAARKVYFDIEGCTGTYPRVIRVGLK
ncbi:hypothetical protein [Gynuella sunshinyii]|uniref:Uncharacterized protein n=1 Tax=Gynuella sunshinyii YC6258 TaxID=1445510 RepID=A0A0C5VPJ2_9GAMM|nr:hypothetical protein [Gynuella sunshinyii]AJQ92179.1 hypothetical Protein YC6258_00123 [Gynuella sunshinyii YC6258]